jgi:hypothetical protein
MDCAKCIHLDQQGRCRFWVAVRNDQIKRCFVKEFKGGLPPEGPASAMMY